MLVNRALAEDARQQIGRLRDSGMNASPVEAA
jgi:hypothetical protein